MKNQEGTWTLLTNHGRILVLIAREPSIKIKELADLTGVTERRAQTIVSDLEQAGYLTKVREGRRNHYLVNGKRPFRHSTESGHRVEELIQLFV